MTLTLRWDSDPAGRLAALPGLSHGAWLATILGALLALWMSGNGKRRVALLFGWLIAAGNTNREMAENLLVPPETVKTHVRHGLNRFGMARKAEICALIHSPKYQ